MKVMSLVTFVCLVASVGFMARAEEEEFKINGDPAKGEPTYRLYCAACHGDTGHGDGIASAALNPKPRNFSDKALMDTISDQEIYTIIKDGGPAVGKSLFMTAWGAVFGEDQKIHDVAAYVRTLAVEPAEATEATE